MCELHGRGGPVHRLLGPGPGLRDGGDSSPGPYEGGGSACGYAGVVRLADGRLLCVFHTDYVDGDCEIRAVRPREEE